MSAHATQARVVQKLLPLSRIQLQWRAADRCFRIRRPEPASTATGDSEHEPLWQRWSARGDLAVGLSGALTTDPQTRWWMVWGEYVGEIVTVTLSEGTTPQVSLFGGLWISEWHGPEHTTIATTARRRSEVRFATTSFPH